MGKFPSDRSIASSVLLESITRSAYSERAPGQLQPLQWSILRYLKSCDEEFATVGYTARFLSLSHAPVSRSITTLIKKGFLKKFEHPYDARGSVLKLTENGQNLVKVDPLHRLAFIVDDLPEPLREAFQLAVEQIVTNQAADT